MPEAVSPVPFCPRAQDAVKSSVSELTRRLAQLQHHGDEQKANVGRLQGEHRGHPGPCPLGHPRHPAPRSSPFVTPPPLLEDNREIKERLEQQRQQLEEAQTDR